MSVPAANAPTAQQKDAGMGVHVALVHVKAARSSTGSCLVSARGDTGLDERSQDT